MCTSYGKLMRMLILGEKHLASSPLRNPQLHPRRNADILSDREGQPKSLINHLPQKGGFSLVIRRAWTNAKWVPSCSAFVGLALVVLLLTRVAPGSIPHVSSNSPTVNSSRQHGPKPCFDQDEAYGCVAIAVFSPAIPLAFSPLMQASDPIVPLDASGTHYTRPPPLV